MVKKQEKKPWLGVEVVDVRLIEGSGSLKAFADLKFEVAGDADFEGHMVVKGFCVIEGKKGLFVTSPRKAAKDGRWYDVLEMDARVSASVEEKVLFRYNEAIEGR